MSENCVQDIKNNFFSRPHLHGKTIRTKVCDPLASGQAIHEQCPIYSLHTYLEVGMAMGQGGAGGLYPCPRSQNVLQLPSPPQSMEDNFLYPWGSRPESRNYTTSCKKNK